MDMAMKLRMKKVASGRNVQFWIQLKGPDELAWIITVFASLATGKENEAVILNREPKVIAEFFGFVLRTTGISSLTKHMFSCDGDSSGFMIWICTKDGWLDCRDFVEAIRSAGGAGHQYLSGAVGDPEIVISYLE